MRHGSETGILLGLLLGLATAGVAGQGTPADDDLAVVKKAVATEPTPAPKVASARSFSKGDPTAPRSWSAQPRWLKVRVVESGAHKSRVTVNLPLAMVRAQVDGEIDLGSSHLRLSEVLQTLESGEPLVEVKSSDSTVRVWVE